MSWLRGSICLLILGLSASSVWAATISLVEGNSRPVLIVSGPFEPNDEDTFTEKALRLKDAIVIFASPGGNLVAGIEIGKAIRLKGFTTVVPSDELCASACALAWLGGTKRFAGSNAQIGFHAAWRMEGEGKVEAGAGNALVGAYLHSLGLSDDAIVFVTSAPPDKVEWLNFEKAERFGIAVREFPSEPQTDVVVSSPRNGSPPPPYSPSIQTGASQQSQPQGLPYQRPNTTQVELIDLALLDAAEQVQRRLQERGYFQGVADGVWGLRSRIALRTFKSRNGLVSDDAWDLQTQSALFDDQSAMWSSYQQSETAAGSDGLFKPFAPRPGATLHPLNPADAGNIQAYLYRLGYYRKQGDGTWGKASRSALLDFKIANGLVANDAWDSSVEDASRRPYVVPATATPFGDWAQDPRSCSDPARVGGRMSVTAQSIEAGGALCKLDTPLQRAPDGWRGVAVCSRGEVTEVARVHLQLANSRLLDRSQVGRVPNATPASFSRCPAMP